MQRDLRQKGPGRRKSVLRWIYNTNTCIYLCIHVTHVYMYVYMQVCVYMCRCKTCVYVYIYIWICIYTWYIYVYVYMYPDMIDANIGWVMFAVRLSWVGGWGTVMFQLSGFYCASNMCNRLMKGEPWKGRINVRHWQGDWSNLLKCESVCILTLVLE